MVIVQVLLSIWQLFGTVEGLSFSLSQHSTQWCPPTTAFLQQSGCNTACLHQKRRTSRSGWELYSISRVRPAPSQSDNESRNKDQHKMEQLDPKTEEEMEPILNSSLKDESKIMGGMASTRLSQHERWNRRYQELQEYQTEHGDCLVPSKYHPNPALCMWVTTQRRKYFLFKSKQGAPLITPERIELLEQLGFVWDAHVIPSTLFHDQQWNMRYQELKEYQAEHGDCLVPHKYPPNPALGYWVSSQRTSNYFLWANEIAPERIKLLEKLGFVWKVN
eukprot:scaffold15801_cov49-Attheya_sp.AAC.4